MKNMILTATNGMHKAAELLTKFVNGVPLKFEEKEELLEIFRTNSSFNKIIGYAEEMAHSDIDGLEKDVKALLVEANALSSLFESHMDVLMTFNTEKDCELHLRPYRDAFKDAEIKAQEAWEEFKPVDHRLNNWWYTNPGENEGFIALEKERDVLKAKYDEFHNECKRLSEAEREETIKISGLMYFDITLIQMLAINLVSIANNFLSDIDTYKKGGGYAE